MKTFLFFRLIELITLILYLALWVWHTARKMAGKENFR